MSEKSPIFSKYEKFAVKLVKFLRLNDLDFIPTLTLSWKKKYNKKYLAPDTSNINFIFYSTTLLIGLNCL